VFTQGASPEASTTANGVQPLAQLLQRQVDQGEIPLSKRKKKATRPSPEYAEYDWVENIAAYENPWGYPAPAGEEDNELLQNTLTVVKQCSPFPESRNGDRRGDSRYLKSWFFAQVVGNDPDSAGYHYHDLKIVHIDPHNGRTRTRRYGAAFDIVFTHVPVFVPGGRRTAFGPFLKALRDRGIVAWHRWAGENHNNDNKLASVQNEMHCIDPAYPWDPAHPSVPLIKSALLRQIAAFKNRSSGGNDYDPEPKNRKSLFMITDNQADVQVPLRETTKRAQYSAIYHDAEGAPPPP